jgi:hypothetical protein
MGREPREDRGEEFFRPTRRAWGWLGGLVLAAFGVAFYLRYGLIQNTPIGLACDAGEASFACAVRSATLYLFKLDMFGAVALAAAAFQLCRPNIIAFGISLIAAALGLVLYNTRLSGLAVALLIFSLARLVREARQARAE